MATFRAPAGTLEIHTEQIDVTSALPYPDKRWTYTDQQGHDHYWREGYPTLTWIVDSSETYWCEDCGEEHERTEGHYECPLCGETIAPGLCPPDTFRRFAPGRTSYTLDGQPITKEQAEAIIEERRAQRG